MNSDAHKKQSLYSERNLFGGKTTAYLYSMYLLLVPNYIWFGLFFLCGSDCANACSIPLDGGGEHAFIYFFFLVFMWCAQKRLPDKCNYLYTVTNGIALHALRVRLCTPILIDDVIDICVYTCLL